MVGGGGDVGGFFSGSALREVGTHPSLAASPSPTIYGVRYFFPQLGLLGDACCANRASNQLAVSPDASAVTTRLSSSPLLSNNNDSLKSLGALYGMNAPLCTQYTFHIKRTATKEAFGLQGAVGRIIPSRLLF